METNSNTDLQAFLDKVSIAYSWLCDFYELMAPLETNDDKKSPDQDVPSHDDRKVLKKDINILILDQDLKPKTTEIPFSELHSDDRSQLEKSIFKRIFSWDKDHGVFTVKNKFRNGCGFYSLSNEILSFLMIYTKKILLSADLYDVLQFTPCDNEMESQAVCQNFWKSFATSFLYINCFNVLILLICLENMREDYAEGKALRGVNSTIDIKTLIKIDDLYQLLDIYDYYESSGNIVITDEYYKSIKGKLPSYMELMSVIEDSIWSILDMNINTSYITFILCTGFAHDQFNITSGALVDAQPSHVANIKIIFDRYIEEIIGYAMDHFKDFTQIHSVRKSFFYHWRTLLGYLIDDPNHMINVLFDDKLHSRLTSALNQISGFLQKSRESMRDSKKDRNKKEDKIKQHLMSCKNLGLLIINIPCNSQNRYTQIKLLTKIEEIEREFPEFLSGSRDK